MWSHVICDTITGSRLQTVFPSEGSWKTSITSIGQGSHTFKLADEETRLDRATWQNLVTPWARTLVTCWEDVPAYAGLLSGRSYDPFTSTLVLRSRELRSIWGSRMPFTVPAYVPTGVSAVSGKSLRGIMRQLLIWGALNASPSSEWWLPIVLPADEAGGYSRSWQMYNFETVEQLLTEIEGEDGGPDLNLRPRWSGSGTLEWEARIGAPLGGPTFEWDLSAEESGLTSFGVDVDAAAQLTGVFGLGAGSDADMLVGLGKNSDVPGPTIPNLDAARSFKTIADTGQLTASAIAELRAFRWPSQSTTISTIASEVLPTMVLGSTLRTRSTDDPFLSDGWFTSTVTSMAGTLGEQLTLEVS